MSQETEWVYKGPGQRPSPGTENVQPGANWVLFAGIMLALVGILNVIYGIGAVTSSHFFDDNADYLVSGLRTWGWVGLIVGAVQLLAAASIWRGGTFGRWAGITLAGLNLIGALLSAPGAPFWSLTIVAIDVLVLYGLAAHGGKKLLV